MFSTNYKVSESLGYYTVQHIAEKFNPLSRAQQRYRRQTDGQTDGRLMP